MNAGFLSPSFRMLEVNWQHDFEMVKLGVPTFMGYLYRAGHRELHHWDFDAQVCELLERDPQAFDIKLFFQPELVQGFLAGTDDTLRAPTETFLDCLGVTRCDIFGLSLAAVLDRIKNVIAIAAVCQCMAKVLKERFPECYIVLGGMQVNPDPLAAHYYRRFLEECPFIDYVLTGRANEVAVQLYRYLWRGELDKIEGLERVYYRAKNERGEPELRLSSGGRHMPRERLDPDLAALPQLQFDSHHRAHTKAGALAQHDETLRRAEELSQRVFTASDLLRKHSAPPPEPLFDYAQTHLEDGTEISAEQASGGMEYETIPARVPIFDPKLVDAFRYSGQQIMKRFHFDKERMLRFSRFEKDRIVVLPHIFVKGCNAPCGFCSYAYQSIEGEDIIQTVEGLKFLSETYDCKHFHFLNTQINSVYQYCEAFCDAVVKANLKIFWSDCCNMRFLDEKLLDKIRAAGGMRLVYGIESPEDEMLRYIHKGITVAKIERLMKAAHERGIWNHCLLIAGMPHETQAKLDKMGDFFRRTAEHIDFYTVSSYYLIASSPWGREPEKYGIERISSPDDLLEQQAFNEKAEGRWSSDNLRWPEKKQQIIDSTRFFYKTISAAKGQSRSVGGNIDLYLLMFLYSTLGFDQKAEIRKIYEETGRHISPSLSPSDNGASGENAVPPHGVSINIPVIIGRTNEGDQSSLLQLPVTLLLSLKDQQRAHFCAGDRFAVTYLAPRSLESQELSLSAMAHLKAELPEMMNKLSPVLGNLLRILEKRFSPETPEAMAELLGVSLPRFRPFANFGYTVAGPPEGRTLLERTLQWNGARS